MARVTEAHLEARRKQIVEAAWQSFARQGYHQTTMQDIADAAGLSAGAIYRYFPGKDALLKAINDRSQEMGRALLAVARSRAQGPVDVLQVLGETLFSVFYDPLFEATTRANVEIWPEMLRSELLRAALRQELTFWREAVAELLREAQRRGDLKPEVDPEAAVILFMAAWEGLRQWRMIDPENFTPERVLQAMQPVFGGVMTVQLDPSGQAARAGPHLEPPFGTRMPGPRQGEKQGQDERDEGL